MYMPNFLLLTHHGDVLVAGTWWLWSVHTVQYPVLCTFTCEACCDKHNWHHQILWQVPPKGCHSCQRIDFLKSWRGRFYCSEVSMVCTKILEIPEQLQIPDHQLLFCLAPPPRIFFGLSSSFRETMHLNSIYWHELVYEYGEESVLNLCGFTLFLIYVLPSRPRPAISHVS